MSASDPLKEMRAVAGSTPAEVRRFRMVQDQTEDILKERQPRRTGVCLAAGSTESRMSASDPLKEMRAVAGSTPAKVRR